MSAARAEPTPIRSISRSDRARRVEDLLAGESSVDGSGIGYDFDGAHVGLIALGPGAMEAIDAAARTLSRPTLLVEAAEGALWGWLGGGGEESDTESLKELLCRRWPRGSFVALGEPGTGPGGWRLTHRQARAALAVARRGDQPVVRYGDVALLASILRDDLLATSLWRLYLMPLEDEPDGGEELRRTLRAYFAAGRNASRAAAELGVTRQAVMRRVRAAEEKIGRSIDSFGAELEVALRFDALETMTRPSA